MLQSIQLGHATPRNVDDIAIWKLITRRFAAQDP